MSGLNTPGPLDPIFAAADAAEARQNSALRQMAKLDTALASCRASFDQDAKSVLADGMHPADFPAWAAGWWAGIRLSSVEATKPCVT